MSFILSIETATGVCSVAIHRQNECIVELISREERSHSEKLPSLISNALNDSELKFDDLTAVAISKGPGSYTGLRIGVSMAKGIAFANNLPLISVNTLKAMALKGTELLEENELICPMIDARRSEVYCLVTDEKLNTIWDTRALIVEKNSFDPLIAKSSILFLGDGSEKFEEMWKNNARFRQIPGLFPSAKYIGLIAQRKYMEKEFENTSDFEPYYLKDFQPGIKKKTLTL